MAVEERASTQALDRIRQAEAVLDVLRDLRGAERGSTHLAVAIREVEKALDRMTHELGQAVRREGFA